MKYFAILAKWLGIKNFLKKKMIKRNSLFPFALELGGNAPFIVFKVTDPA